MSKDVVWLSKEQNKAIQDLAKYLGFRWSNGVNGWVWKEPDCHYGLINGYVFVSHHLFEKILKYGETKK